MLRKLKSIFLLNIKLAEMNTMQNHVHTGKIIGGAVEFLPVKLADLCFFGNPQQQGTGATGRVIG